jgi:hypothetical protein
MNPTGIGSGATGPDLPVPEDSRIPDLTGGGGMGGYP